MRSSVIVLVVGGWMLACGAPPERPPRVQAKWEDGIHGDCRPRLVIRLRSARKGTTLSAGGLTSTAEKRGDVTVILPSGTDTATAEVAAKVDDRDVTVKVPSYDATRIKRPPARYPKPRGDWRGTVATSVAGAVKDSHLADAEVDETGTLAVPLPCAITGGTADVGELRVTDGTPVVTIDVLGGLLDAAEWTDKHPVDFKATVDTHGGEPAQVEATGSVDARKVVAAAFARVESGGLAWAPARQRGKQPALIVVNGDTPDASLLDGQPARAAAVVALVTVKPERVKSCGFYSGEGKMTPVDRYRSDAHIAMFVANTGEALGDTTLKGKVPKCPKFVQATDYGTTMAARNVMGEPPMARAIKWISKRR